MVGWMESKRDCRIPERLCSAPRGPVVAISGNVSENGGCVQSRHSSGESVRHELRKYTPVRPGRLPVGHNGCRGWAKKDKRG